MGKEKKEEKPIIQMQTKKISPEQIMQRANQAKDKFSASKGKSDQIIADSLSNAMNEMLAIVQGLLKERMQDEGRIKELEDQLKAKGEPKVKKLPEPEKPNAK